MKSVETYDYTAFLNFNFTDTRFIFVDENELYSCAS